MSKRILCCINGSAHARRAVEVAVRIAAGLGQGLSFLLVNQLRPASGFPPSKALTDVEAKEILDIAARYAASHGVKDVKRILFENEDVAAAILECAEKIEADHIVVGTGNPPFIGRLLLGSVSETVTARAKCTVTIAR